MNSFAAFVAASALIVPGLAPAPPPDAVHEAREAPGLPGVAGPRSEPEPFRNFRESYRPDEQDQVRIEEHVIIRITPTSPALREEMFAPPPGPDRPVHYRETKHDDCVDIDKIAGISPMESNRLAMFMTNHRILSLALERACDADAFYLGAYVERSRDGKLCTGRDLLRARSGATCRVSRISRLVAVKD